jgi:hypothetical protein
MRAAAKSVKSRDPKNLERAMKASKVALKDAPLINP